MAKGTHSCASHERRCLGSRAGFARKYNSLDIEECGRKFSEGMGCELVNQAEQSRDEVGNMRQG